MIEHEPKIVELTAAGLSINKIAKRLNLPPHTVRRIARASYGPRSTLRNGKENSIGAGTMMAYITECLRRLGKNPLLCEVCLEPQLKRCEIHHTKYEGATIYDLKYVCRSCNLARANVGLA